MFTGDLKLLVCRKCVVFEFYKIEGTKIIAHVKSPNFRAAKLKGFYSIMLNIWCLFHHHYLIVKFSAPPCSPKALRLWPTYIQEVRKDRRATTAEPEVWWLFWCYDWLSLQIKFIFCVWMIGCPSVYLSFCIFSGNITQGAVDTLQCIFWKQNSWLDSGMTCVRMSAWKCEIIWVGIRACIIFIH